MGAKIMPCHIIALLGFDTVCLDFLSELLSKEFLINKNGDVASADLVLVPEGYHTPLTSKKIMKIKLPLKTEEVITLKNRVTNALVGSA